MIITKISPWTQLAGLTHVATSYRLYSDSLKSNMVDLLLTSTSLTSWISMVTIPLNTVYYVTTERHLSDGSTTGESSVMPVQDTDQQTSAPTLDDLHITTPIVSIDTNSWEDALDPNFKVNTTDFSCVGDGHAFTTYFITDIEGNVLWRELCSQNLLTTTVPKIIVSNHDRVIVNAIHVTGLGVESPVGSVNLDTTPTDYSIITNLQLVTPDVDYNVQLSPIGTNALNVNSVTLSDSFNLLWSGEVIDNSFTIPGNLLSADGEFLLRLFTDVVNSKAYTTHTLTTSCDVFNYDNLRDKVYEPTFTNLTSIGSHLGLGELTTYENVGGSIITTHNNALGLYTSRLDPVSGLISGNPTLINGSSVNRGDGPCVIHKLTNGDIMVNYIDKITTLPTTQIYRMDNYNNSVVLLLEFSDTVNDTVIGLNGSLHNVNNDTIVYLNNLGVVINKDVKTGSTIDSFDTGTLGCVMLSIGDDKYLLVNGDVTTLVYDNVNKTTLDSITTPTYIRSGGLKMSRLINGDSIILNYDIGNNLLLGNYGYYGLTNGIIEVRNTGLQLTSGYNNLVKLMSGEILFINDTISGSFITTVK